MTTGYRDWQRVVAQSDSQDILLNEFGVAHAGNATHGPFHVGQFQGLGVIFEPTGGRAQIDLAWSADQAGAVAGARLIHVVRSSSSLRAVVPVRGAWVLVGTGVNGGGAHTDTLRLWGTQGDRGYFADIYEGDLLSTGEITLVTGVAQNFNFARAHLGRCHLYTSVTAGPLTLLVQGTRLDATLDEVEQVSIAGAGNDRRDFHCPALDMRVNAVQTSGANAAFRCTIIPIYPGTA